MTITPDPHSSYITEPTSPTTAHGEIFAPPISTWVPDEVKQFVKPEYLPESQSSTATGTSTTSISASTRSRSSSSKERGSQGGAVIRLTVGQESEQQGDGERRTKKRKSSAMSGAMLDAPGGRSSLDRQEREKSTVSPESFAIAATPSMAVSEPAKCRAPLNSIAHPPRIAPIEYSFPSTHIRQAPAALFSTHPLALPSTRFDDLSFLTACPVAAISAPVIRPSWRTDNDEVSKGQ